ncbi:MAG: hypothetical protein JNK63_07880 [Chthonomonas sp.]|nr:hypothetical protein [Chthonomonas sp.]
MTKAAASDDRFPGFHESLIGTDFKETYGCKCSECGYEFAAKPSLLMLSGVNKGSGSCIECKTLLRLSIDDSGEYMNSARWEAPNDRP